MKFIRFILVSAIMLSSLAFAQVNINTATVEELTSLKGIGEKKAKAIVKYREKNGQFSTPADLQQVEGIGEKTINNLGRDVRVKGKTDIEKLLNQPKTKTEKTKTETETEKTETEKAKTETNEGS